jgi:SAM-dependent methyltransferase
VPNDPVPSDQIDSYEILAKHYDAAYAAEQFQADVPFYVDLAKQSGGPVLEIACGTGRVLLNIAREGIPTDGIDNSPAMLRILRSKLEREPPHVRDRVGIHEGDMRSFRLNKKYPLVIIPFRPMQHTYTLRDQLDALTTAAAHLQNDGNLAFDVFYPKFAAIETGIGQEILDLEWPIDLARQRIVRRYFRKDSVDKIRQLFTGTFIFRTYEGNALVLEETDALKLSYYTCPHLRALFLLAGLEVVEEYGSFTKALLDNEATQMIFIVRKTSQIQAPSRNRQD